MRSDGPERLRRFSELHRSGLFVMPNAWDAGSARILESMGFPAIATTSSGHAATLGRVDGSVTLDELLAHTEALVRAVDIPVNVDAERCFADDPAGVATTVERIAETGAAGCSIEDYEPGRDAIDQVGVAAERVAAAADAAHRHGLTLTARAENHFHGVEDVDDTVARLRAYREAGADVLYAPGLTDATDIQRVVREAQVAVNVLAMRGTPPVPILAEIGVRRISTGGALVRAAYGALRAAAAELGTEGTSTYLDAAIPGAELDAILGRDRS